MSAPRRLAAIAAIVLLGTLAALPAAAYFEETAVGARAIALGAAAGANTTDGTAYYWNPAGLAELGRTEVVGDFAKPYGLTDLDVGSVAVSTRWRGTGWALAWHRLGIANAYAEDQLQLAAGRRLMSSRLGHALEFGATFKWGHVGFQPFDDEVTGQSVDYGSMAKGDLDAGLRWVTPWRVDFAWVARDLLQPRYELVPGSGGQAQAVRNELSAAFRWNRESTIDLGWSQRRGQSASINAGLEILFFDVFAIRTGLANTSVIYQSLGSPNDFQLSGGFGVYHKGYYVDASAFTNRDLGASYRASIRIPIGSAVGRRP